MSAIRITGTSRIAFPRYRVYDTVINVEPAMYAMPISVFLQRMLEADGIVLASPVYLDHVTAQMKALLDRSSHFVHCLRLTGKYLAAVTTSGGGSGEATGAFLRRYAMTVGAQFVGGVHAPLPLREPDLVAARELGAALVDAVAGKTAWPEQVRAIGEQRERFGRIIAFHKDKWPYEHQYWLDKGWLQNGVR